MKYVAIHADLNKDMDGLVKDCGNSSAWWSHSRVWAEPLIWCGNEVLILADDFSISADDLSVLADDLCFVW